LPIAVAADEPGLMDTLLEDPLALTGGGLVVALLAGFGVYRYVKRARKESGETSFLESRLQPDSFFGVSGGQQIDTREAAAGSPSSISYSLSQLDAIGDVDPVAEADVYLAYGRDLQAEEILKEAIRANPSRLAIRTKLLEVYAKRRDTKGFELLAQQLFGLTRGSGEDWAKAQELGAQIDPDNPLYRPGGQPELLGDQDQGPIEPLGASTMPQSVLPSPSQFGELGMATAVMAPSQGAELDFDLDLDLDLDMPAPSQPAPPRLPETTRPLPAQSPATEPNVLEFDLPLEAPPAPFEPSAPAPLRDLSLDFDLAGISLDLDAPPLAAAPPGPPSEHAALDLPDLSDLGDLGDGAEDGVDPFERRLELAEEFRQIGDMDGARDLLEEVIAQTGGAIQAKARAMLDSLS
jgi:pilus assembly protein FimV